MILPDESEYSVCPTCGKRVLADNLLFLGKYVTVIGCQECHAECVQCGKWFKKYKMHPEWNGLIGRWYYCCKQCVEDGPE